MQEIQLNSKNLGETKGIIQQEVQEMEGNNWYEIDGTDGGNGDDIGLQWGEKTLNIWKSLQLFQSGLKSTKQIVGRHHNNEESWQQHEIQSEVAKKWLTAAKNTNFRGGDDNIW